jgi:hypothetical protein
MPGRHEGRPPAGRCAPRRGSRSCVHSLSRRYRTAYERRPLSTLCAMGKPRDAASTKNIGSTMQDCKGLSRILDFPATQSVTTPSWDIGWMESSEGRFTRLGEDGGSSARLHLQSPRSLISRSRDPFVGWDRLRTCLARVAGVGRLARRDDPSRGDSDRRARRPSHDESRGEGRLTRTRLQSVITKAIWPILTV